MPIVELLVCVALVVANGFFVVAEFSLVRVRPTQLADWERKGKPGSARCATPSTISTRISPPANSANLRIDHGVGLAGFSTEQLPPASAGASFHALVPPRRKVVERKARPSASQNARNPAAASSALSGVARRRRCATASAC
jgi:hypothetical protein